MHEITVITSHAKRLIIRVSNFSRIRESKRNADVIDGDGRKGRIIGNGVDFLNFPYLVTNARKTAIRLIVARTKNVTSTLFGKRTNRGRNRMHTSSRKIKRHPTNVH